MGGKKNLKSKAGLARVLVLGFVVYLALFTLPGEIESEKVYNQIEEISTNKSILEQEKDREMKSSFISNVETTSDEEIFYEQEPNNSFEEANIVDSYYYGAATYFIFGSITDYYFDLDYFRFDVVEPGTFIVLGIWAEQYNDFFWRGDEEYLLIGLIDEEEEIIDAATLHGDWPDTYRFMVTDVTPGTYYILVLQNSDWEYGPVGQEYAISVEFEPDEEPPEPDPEYDIELSAEPEEGGKVEGAGTYEEGEEVTVYATPEEGCEFINWTEDGQEVSTDAAYAFEVEQDRELVANFSKIEPRIETDRLAGFGRFDTAVDISENTYEDGEADAVVLATGLDFPDALAGVPLSYAKDGPLLLTRSDNLPDETADEIDRVLTEGDTVYVLGGEAAVSEEVADKLDDMNYGVERIAGEGRFDTAVKIAEEVTGSPAEVFLTTGLDFADAVAASSPAAMRGAPILLTHPDELSEDTADYLNDNAASIEEIHIIGGEAAVEDDVKTKAGGTNRVSGANRWATGTAIAEEFFEEPVKATLATGLEFPDALAGGVYAALNDAPVLLTNYDELPGEVKDYFIGEEGIMNVSVFGGDGAVSDSVLRTIEFIE